MSSTKHLTRTLNVGIQHPRTVEQRWKEGMINYYSQKQQTPLMCVGGQRFCKYHSTVGIFLNGAPSTLLVTWQSPPPLLSPLPKRKIYGLPENNVVSIRLFMEQFIQETTAASLQREFDFPVLYISLCHRPHARSILSSRLLRPSHALTRDQPPPTNFRASFVAARSYIFGLA